jgi:peptidoglycan hydrolase CwlO-like protein
MVNSKIKEDEYVLNLKKRIDDLLKEYNRRKADLKWADEDWEIGEIQEDLDRYAREIKKLKNRIKEYNHKQ